jgi:DNA-binding response OmpR family regulator
MRNEGSVSGSAFFKMDDLPQISTSADSPTSVNNRVLIFSSEIETQRLLATLLEMWGYAPAGFDSLENNLADMESREPALILLDTCLPFAAHLENIRRIRRNRFLKETPVVVISGFVQPPYRHLSIAVGASGFFVKPLDFESLENFLKKCTGEKTGKTH